jgi:thiol-disulfide isomerase/thioredoxin
VLGVSVRWLFAGIALLAALAGTAMHFAMQARTGAEATPERPPGPDIAASEVSPAVLLTTRFADPAGQSRTLGQFQGQVVVVNFWATWCAPCREEMPGFSRLQDRWADRGVRFVGLSDEEPAKVARFAADMKVAYPLWVGGAEVMELSRRLGNRLGVLPHTAILDGQGRVVQSRIGLYPEADLEAILSDLSSKVSKSP